MTQLLLAHHSNRDPPSLGHGRARRRHLSPLGARRVGEQQGCSGLGQEVFDLARARARSDADDDRARLLDAEIAGVHLGTVGEHHCDPIAALDS